MPMNLRLNGQMLRVSDPSPNLTLLEWLRASGHTGSKEGCAEGDCGACTVAVLDHSNPNGAAWRSICSCIVPLFQLADQEVVTVEGLAEGEQLHPAQAALVSKSGSQCGYCTPGFVMSLFEATYREDLADPARRDDQICGNLCRCTGYRPIREALEAVAGLCPKDRFRERLSDTCTAPPDRHWVSEEGQALRPASYASLWRILETHPHARFVAGATDLGLEITRRGKRFDTLIDISALPEMSAMEIDSEGRICLGGGVHLSDLETWSQDNLPMLARMLRYFASRQIKNRATLAGNLCNASPIGDLAPVFLALDAVFLLRSATGEREVRASDFFLSYRKTALGPGEVLRAVVVHPNAGSPKVGAYKVSKRRELDISAVSGAFVVETDAFGRVTRARFAFGGMAATPARAFEAERAIQNEIWGVEAVEMACDALGRDFQPIDDHRASAWYRTTVAANLLRGFALEWEAHDSPQLPARPSHTFALGEEA
jgi:xanthine dehydrogenase small subunit